MRVSRSYLEQLSNLEFVYPADVSFELSNDKVLKREAAFIIDHGSDFSTKEALKFPSASDAKFGAIGMHETCNICGAVDCGGHNGYFRFPKTSNDKRIMIAKPDLVGNIMKILSVICHECNSLVLNPANNTDKTILDKIKATPKSSKLTALVAATGAQNRFQECTKTTKNKKGDNLCCSCKVKPLSMGEIKSKFPFLSSEIGNAGKKKKKTDKPTYEDDEEESTSNTKTKSYLPRQAYEIISRVDPIIARDYLGVTKDEIRGMFATGMVILSPKFRPDVGPDRQDDLTTELKRVYDASFKAIEKESSDIINKLTLAYAEYITVIKKKLGGKKGINRGSIQGKKVNFTARIVAVPASSPVDFWEVEVPKFIADNGLLMGDNFVTAETLEMYQDLLFNGIIGIVNKGSGTRNLWKPIVVGDDNFSDRSEHILSVGDRVHLRAQDGDFILIGRQPTHNQQNIIGVKIKITDGNTIGTHISITPYTHLDYDGDQLWAASLQTKEAREELETSLSARNVIRTYQNNTAMTGLVYNATTAAALLTRPDTMVTQDLFNRATESYHDLPRFATHLERCKRWGIDPLSGASLFSTLLPEDFYYRGGNKEEKKGVEIRQGILVSGMITKKTAGNGGNGIVDRLILMYPDKIGYDHAVNFINDGTRMLNIFLDSIGFTISYEDCLLERDYQPEVRQKLEDMRTTILKMKKPETRIEEEVYEKKVEGLINKMTEIGRDKLVHTVNSDNAMIFMSELGSGTKGKKGNIYTISVSIGQQRVEGKRFQSKMSGDSRCTATDMPYDIFPESKGYIVNSYVSGMTPLETWQASAGIRSGLVQTATTTHLVGWTQRHLQNATADITTKKGSAVFHDSTIIEWCYGGDSCDGLYLETVDGSIQAININSVIDKFNTEYELGIA